MKKYLLSILMALPVLVLGSCEKKSEGLTRTTAYAILTLDGESTVFVDKGTAYAEPGYTATIDGKDVKDQVAVTSNVDTNTSGIYSVVYKITTKDGFSASATRTVIVLDSNDNVEGIYALNASSNRNGTLYGKPFEFMVINKGDHYEFDDILGGWYAQRAGYGSDYAMQASVSIASDGTITLIDSYVNGWGDSLNEMSDDSKYDFETHTFTYSVLYGGNYSFNVSATRK